MWASLPIAAVVLIGFGYRTGVLGGFSSAELDRLEREWAQVEAWAATPFPDGIENLGRTSRRILPQFVDREQRLGRWPVDPESDADLEPLVECLEANPGSVLIDDRSRDMYELREILVQVSRRADLPPRTFRAVARLARSTTILERGNTLFGQLDIGLKILTGLLDLAEGHPDRKVILRELPAPQRDELFLTWCAVAVTLDGYGPPTDLRVEGAIARRSRGRTFAAHAYRRCLADEVLAVEPLREDPMAWASLPDHPDPLGYLYVRDTSEAWGLFVRDPETWSRFLRRTTQLSPQGWGPGWGRFVERWEQVVGS